LSHFTSPVKDFLNIFLVSFFFFLIQDLAVLLRLAGLELMIFLLQPPKCWDYRHVPQCSAPDIFLLFERYMVIFHFSFLKLVICFLPTFFLSRVL
jgi:hypothetical protein